MFNYCKVVVLHSFGATEVQYVILLETVRAVEQKLLPAT
jgi:hypothetical protein